MNVASIQSSVKLWIELQTTCLTFRHKSYMPVAYAESSFNKVEHVVYYIGLENEVLMDAHLHACFEGICMMEYLIKS